MAYKGLVTYIGGGGLFPGLLDLWSDIDGLLMMGQTPRTSWKKSRRKARRGDTKEICILDDGVNQETTRINRCSQYRPALGTPCLMRAAYCYTIMCSFRIPSVRCVVKKRDLWRYRVPYILVRWAIGGGSRNRRDSFIVSMFRSSSKTIVSHPLPNASIYVVHP